MSPSWFRSTLDERFKWRNRRQDRQLDERFGDLSISGPTLGGWNQVPSARLPPAYPRRRAASATREFQSENARHGNGGSSRRSSLSLCKTPSATREMGGPPSTTANHDKPGFVYKPVSEKFFEAMAEIGKPTRATHQPVDKRQRRHSIQSESSMEPSSPAAIPCHPSYQARPFLPSPNSTPPLAPPDRPIERQKYYNSPDLTGSDAPEKTGDYAPISQESPTTKHPKPRATYPRIALSTKRKKTRSNRCVTEELVPSTTELFG
ncbi:hypothetical protein VTO42DRAFT_4959 [Malbranchea cinnamomea]